MLQNLFIKKRKTFYPHSGTSLLTDISQNVKEDKELVSTVVLSIIYGIKLTENIIRAVVDVFHFSYSIS